MQNIYGKKRLRDYFIIKRIKFKAQKHFFNRGAFCIFRQKKKSFKKSVDKISKNGILTKSLAERTF